MDVCAVIWTDRDGDCPWCHRAKSLHLRPLSRSEPRVFVCSSCGYKMWDAAYDDVNAHWETHLTPTAMRGAADKLGEAMG